ncbi:MAG: Asp-tRNA(Asn)/Glu-tRNA(Gln) amidotransferase subunit GatC [Spirochaetes bacterium]|nr:Asp-tRNA(Asn)/Glu-tRNA(Gln) amidotransferase subunit GatC [Spirochaetota bacterium]
MVIDTNVILKVAELARLQLTEQEKEEFCFQLNNIVQYFERINQIDTTGIKPAEHIVELKNVFRKDEKLDRFNPDDFKQIVPHFEENHVVVPALIEER